MRPHSPSQAEAFQVVVSAAVSELREVYEGALEKALRTEVEPMAAD